MLPPDSAPLEPEPSEPAALSGDRLPGDFFVVGMGASAGGLEAFSEILKRVPLRTNVAIVLVQHLDPNHQSLLVELLNRVTSLPVQWATNRRVIEAGNVYVAPPHTCMTVEEGTLVLHQPSSDRFVGDVDFFLQSLAQDFKHRAVAVILSGSGGDGTAGTKAIKGMGGIVIAQEPGTASFPSMPRAAMNGGCVDRVLTPIGIAEELVKLAQHAPVLWKQIAPADESPVVGSEAEHLLTIFRLLTARTGVDFADYKQSTIKRRLARQMMIGKVSDLGEYVKILQKNREELDKLYESLLINVTDFFRDTEYWDFLQKQILPDLADRRPENAPIRVWVPGCSTGEEAYSLGILLRELMEEKSCIIPVQIFGTDVSDQAIAHARGGIFSAADVGNVSPERLKRFFYKIERGYMIQKPIRDMCVFARQNVAKDSPFSRLDLVSCRNLLIYLSPRLQRKVMPIFHYALNPDRYLVLGNSESVGAQAELFRLIDRRFRIYTRKSTSRRTAFEFSVNHSPSGVTPLPRPSSTMTDDLKESFDIIREADRIVLHRHGPIGVLVNESLEILQFRGDVSPYLSPVPGRASLNLIKMAREGLAGELQAAMHEAREKNVRVHRAGVPVTQGDLTRAVDLDVTPIDPVHTKERFYLVLFTPADASADASAGAPPDAPADGQAGKVETKADGKVASQQMHVDQLRQDLQATRNYLQSTIEKHEATNQELRAANEEIQSANEELQSTNEELETAKEELQSTNEELTTVNEELHSRQLELIQVNNDLNNLINSVHLPIIILGQDLRIRRFTPMAEKVLNVIPTDVGRPLSDLNTNLQLENLPRLVAEVIDSLTVKELEVQDTRGRWYSLRLRPYRTADHKIDGVVLTLIDIDQTKRTMGEIEEARNFSRAILEMSRDALAVIEGEGDWHVKMANQAFYALLGFTPDQLQRRTFVEAAKPIEVPAGLRSALQGILPTPAGLTDFEIALDLGDRRPTRLLLNARQIAGGMRSIPLILLSLRRSD